MRRIRVVLTLPLVVLILADSASRAEQILPNDDCYVENGVNRDDNGIIVKTVANRNGWVEFTLGTTPAASATLGLYEASGDGDTTFNVRGGAYNFDEGTFTGTDTTAWSDLGTVHYTAGWSWYVVDITSFYNGHLGQTVTFHLKPLSSPDRGPMFEDREGSRGSGNHPCIDWTAGSVPPVIAEVVPDPDTGYVDVGYIRQLSLLQGTAPVSWSVLQGPTGLIVDQSGRVSGWTPGTGDVGSSVTIEIQATNLFGSDTETWQVQVLSEPQVPKWQMYEVSLTASGSPANPFTDVWLTATVTPPGGGAFVIDGFYDGDGSGGQSGNVWKLRFSPNELGVWQWTTSSNDAGLNNQSGQFQCVASGEPGPIIANGRYFHWADGGPVYLIGNFLDRVQPTYEEFSHTLLSEEISESNRQNMIARHRDFHKANKMNVYLANNGDYGDVSTTPWVGSDNSNDKTRFDLSRWHMYDRIIAQLKDEGMVAELWFFADDSGFGDLPDADRQRLIRYGMARLSAYPHTMFVLCLEWQEGWSSSEVSSHMTYGQNHNPWDRLWSVHGTTGNFAFPGEAWADFMATQSGNDITPSANNTHTITNRGLANKPLIVEEFGLLDSTYDKRLRGNLWACFCGGGAGSGTGSDLPRLRKFIEDVGVEFWTMAPDNSVTSSGFALVNPGSEYVVYVETGGTFSVQLAPGTYDAEWFSPRQSDGEAGPIAIGSVSGGAQNFTTPNSDDWVLHVRKRVVLKSLVLTETNAPWGDVEMDPEPNDPNNSQFPQGTAVTLTAVPVEGKAFSQWQIMDPNVPGDANYATIDTNLSTTIVMDTDMHVNAVWKCASESGLMPAMAIALLALFMWVWRRQ